jgi:hypothetical protein
MAGASKWRKKNSADPKIWANGLARILLFYFPAANLL